MARKVSEAQKPVGPAQEALLRRLQQMNVDMKTVSTKWLRRNSAYIQQWIFRGTPRGLSEKDRHTISFRTGIPEDVLGRPIPEAPDHIPSEQVATGQYRQILPARDPSLIPMYAMAEGGDGTIVTAWDVAGYIDRPAHLFGVKNAYGAYIVGDSMEPAYQRGNRVLVDPNIPPRQDDDALLFKDDIGQATTGLIKRIVRVSQDRWQVEQFNPPKKFDLEKSVWRYCHVVVARYSR